MDNASTDGTVQYLRALDGVLVIANDANRGFPAAVNQGIAVASRRQVLLLNNDTVVTTGWLGRMLRAHHVNRAVGLGGPVSNFVSGPQQVEVGYDNMAKCDGLPGIGQRTTANSPRSTAWSGFICSSGAGNRQHRPAR